MTLKISFEVQRSRNVTSEKEGISILLFPYNPIFISLLGFLQIKLTLIDLYHLSFLQHDLQVRAIVYSGSILINWRRGCGIGE